MAKDTFFCPKKTLCCRGKIINLSAPLVMGILNITPDSFFDGGKYGVIPDILSRAEQMLKEGAGIIDLGAASTRPGAKLIHPEEEIKRLLPGLKALTEEFPEALFSVDTYNAKTAEAAVDRGAHMINDISAGAFDKNMFATIARLQVPYIIMHIKGTPDTMQKNPQYDDLIREVVRYFADRIHDLNRLGVHDIIIDPGFGFGKTLEHNYELLNNLDFFKIFDVPVLAGVSRKSLVNKVLGIGAADALNGTTVVNTMALLRGADILRVHDVKEAVEAIKITQMVRRQNQLD